MASDTTEQMTDDLRRCFGAAATVTPLASPDRMGVRVAGIDLTEPLDAERARLLVALLDHHQIVCFAGQDEHGFDVHDLERVANHYGAPLPHPRNFANYGSGEELELLPVDRRASTRNNEAFPGTIECLPGADSPAVYIVSNVAGGGPDVEPAVAGGQHWHTDIEFEPVPLSTSMFYVHHVPTARTGTGSWVHNPPREPGFYHPESPAELAERREALPLNGETAYADTAAAFAALDADEQRELESTLVRRRFRRDEEGWLAPLVYVNPRNGMRSLHSPIWASRGRTVTPVVVDGLDDDGSRHLLDRLEAHCLRPEFRYDHVHTPGDVTVWSNFSTLHVAPPVKRPINDPADARLMYRISCKGDPAETLPRTDTDDWIDANISPPYRTALR